LLSIGTTQVPNGSRRLIAIFVVDGLRPDSINQADTPTIERLRREGDVMPTVLALLGIENVSCDTGCGRVLRESPKDPPSPPAVKVSRRVVRTSKGAYHAAPQISRIAGRDYVDSGSRQQH
jgi:hypothetical protein